MGHYWLMQIFFEEEVALTDFVLLIESSTSLISWALEITWAVVIFRTGSCNLLLIEMIEQEL